MTFSHRALCVGTSPPRLGVPHVLAWRGHGIAAHAKEPEPSVAYSARQQRQQQQRAVEARHGAGGNFSTVSDEFREDIPMFGGWKLRLASKMRGSLVHSRVLHMFPKI